MASYADEAHLTESEAAGPQTKHEHVGPGLAFLWVAWAVTAAWFFPFALRTSVGILEATGRTDAMPGGAVDAGGMSLVMLEVVGVVILGLALAYGAFRYATRNRALDPIGEAATKAQYDAPHAMGADS